jgi:hypothetical protein
VPGVGGGKGRQTRQPDRSATFEERQKREGRSPIFAASAIVPSIHRSLVRGVLMAKQTAFQKLKSRWAAEIKDEEKLAAHIVSFFFAISFFKDSVFVAV